MSDQDRRMHDRVSWSGPLSIRRGDDHELADACDLSVWGMSFRTRAPLLVGDEIHVHLEDVSVHRSLKMNVRHVSVSRGQYIVGAEHARR